MAHDKRQEYIAAVGMFDGVHRGHAYLLRTLCEKAKIFNLKPLALTFARHPLSILRPKIAPRLLTGVRQRAELIHATGVENVAIFDFHREDFALTAEEFIEKIKIEYSVVALLMGFNNHIGSDRRSGAELRDAGFPVVVSDALPNMEVSSSQVRAAIYDANFRKAEELLSHAYSVCGSVEEGRHIGRTIGFPTANIHPEEDAQLLPPDGVYAVDVLIDGSQIRGMANIGTRPTVGGHRRTFEVHIIDFGSDLYGKQLCISFLSRLRDEQRFESIEALALQLAADKEAALKL